MRRGYLRRGDLKVSIRVNVSGDLRGRIEATTAQSSVDPGNHRVTENNINSFFEVLPTELRQIPLELCPPVMTGEKEKNLSTSDLISE